MKLSAKDKSQKLISTRKLIPQDSDFEKYRYIYENSHLIQITIDLKRRITSINKNGAKELGYDEEELIGADIFTLFLPQEHPRQKTHISNVLEHPNEQFYHEIKMLRKNKQEFWVRENIYCLEDQLNEPQIFFVCNNITYQKNAEAKAKDLAQSLQNMLDASPLGVLVYRLDENDDLILISTNQSAVNILQIDTYALISKKIQDIFPGLSQNHIIEKFKDVLKNGRQLLNRIN